VRRLLLALAACGDSAATPDAPITTGDHPIGGGGWTTGTAVANGSIQETAAVAIAGKIYLIGGFDDDEGVTSRVQIYDTATSTWSDGPALPIALHHATAATDGTTIVVAGFLTGNNFATNGGVYSLAPATETQWQTRAAMPAGRERGAAVADVIAGKLYVVGGWRNLQASNLVDVYDIAANTWLAPLANLPAARDHACGGTISGELVVAGGRTIQTDSIRPEVWSYNPGTNTWTPRAAMPTARGGMGCGVIDDVLYTAGGEGNPNVPSGVFASVEAYSLATNTWTVLDPMPNPKHGVGGAVWDGALYLCGGASTEGFGAIAATDILRP